MVSSIVGNVISNELFHQLHFLRCVNGSGQSEKLKKRGRGNMANASSQCSPTTTFLNLCVRSLVRTQFSDLICVLFFLLSDAHSQKIKLKLGRGVTRGRSFTGDQNNLDNPGKSENSKICLETDYPFLSLCLTIRSSTNV